MAQSRFKRDYKAVITVDSQEITIAPPMRVVFDANKSISGGLNRLTIRFYNLEERKRLALVKDAEEKKYIGLSFEIGYDGKLGLLFKGSVHRGRNYREGPNLITELECLDGGYDFLNSFTSQTITKKQNAAEAILSDMPNTTKGLLTDLQSYIRPKVLVGASGKLFDELLQENETWYIDEEKLYILKPDDVVSNIAPIVKSSTGLLNTPIREQSKVTFDTQLNPELKIGGLSKLESLTAPHLNGTYRNESINYTGDNYGKKWSQSVTGFLYGN